MPVQEGFPVQRGGVLWTPVPAEEVPHRYNDNTICSKEWDVALLKYRHFFTPPQFITMNRPNLLQSTGCCHLNLCRIELNAIEMQKGIGFFSLKAPFLTLE